MRIMLNIPVHYNSLRFDISYRVFLPHRVHSSCPFPVPHANANVPMIRAFDKASCTPWAEKTRHRQKGVADGNRRACRSIRTNYIVPVRCYDVTIPSAWVRLNRISWKGHRGVLNPGSRDASSSYAILLFRGF